MKKLIPYVVFILLLISSFSFGANDQTVQFDLKNCSGSDGLKEFINKYQEEVIFSGAVQKEIKGKQIPAILVVTMSKEGNWTVFEYFDKELICLMESGIKGTQRFPGTVSI